MQNPLTTLPEAIASAERVLARQDGPTVLVGHSFSGHRKLAAALVTIAASGWFTSCAIDALISPRVVTRVTWASSAWAVCSARSAASDRRCREPPRTI